MTSLVSRMDAIVGLYSPFVNNLNGSTLLTLAVATISSLLYSLSQSQIPLFLNNLTLIKSLSITALTLFVWCRDPLRSVKNWYVPLICVFAYLHILVLLTILKQRETYGIPYCCLLVSSTVVLPIAETNTQRFFVWFVAFMLSVVTNLQFQSSDSGTEETIHMTEAKTSHPQASRKLS